MDPFISTPNLHSKPYPTKSSSLDKKRTLNDNATNEYDNSIENKTTTPSNTPSSLSSAVVSTFNNTINSPPTTCNSRIEEQVRQPSPPLQNNTESIHTATIIWTSSNFRTIHTRENNNVNESVITTIPLVTTSTNHMLIIKEQQDIYTYSYIANIGNKCPSSTRNVNQSYKQWTNQSWNNQNPSNQ